MSQVNLLPPEILERQVFRRRATMIVLLGGVFVLAVLLFYFMQTARLTDVNDQIEAQDATNASISAQIADLQEFATLQATAQAKEGLLASAFANEISFSGLLMDMSRVIPSDAYLDSMTIQTTATTAETAPAATDTGVTTTFVGSIQTSGTGLSVDTLATYLTRLESVKGWVNPWLTTLAQATDTGFYTFSAGVDLTDAVVTERGKEAALAGG